uniref:THAP-type domain-containing protein n=1 Tax=Glossina brevipalpis TaxID=37001 RepID=A0A1A9WL26_9MUSC
MVSKHCIVPHCKGKHSKRHPNAHLHRFPKDRAMKMRWISILQLKEEDVQSYSRVCHRHFASEAKKLSPTAVPTLNLEPMEDALMSTAVTTPKLVVPKLKLRVPKEFQKSLDVALSSSESDEDEYEDKENLTDKSKITEYNLMEKFSADDDIATTSMKDEVNTIAADYELLTLINSLNEDDSFDESKSNILRLLQEIEQTKLDIQRTKKVSRHSKKLYVLPKPYTILSQSRRRVAKQDWSSTDMISSNSLSSIAAASERENQCALDVNQTTIAKLTTLDEQSDDITDTDAHSAENIMRTEMSQSIDGTLKTSQHNDFAKTFDVSYSEMKGENISSNSQRESF